MLKIILTGPESSGKTTLARQLAKHFKTPLVEEYVRTFFEKKQTPQYKQEDLLEIAHGQLDLEQQTYEVFKNLIGLSPQLLICDTDLLTIKIWSNEVYGNCSKKLTQLIDNQLVNLPSNITEHYFLCSPTGIEWEEDPLRENPNDRERLFDIYEKELRFYKKNYKILRGSFEERLEKAIATIEKRIFLLGKLDV